MVQAEDYLRRYKGNMRLVGRGREGEREREIHICMLLDTHTSIYVYTHLQM